MQPVTKQRYLTSTAASILVLTWIYVQGPHLTLDPWNDELYTLQHFVLVPFSRTVTDYHVPNNHVLFSLLLNMWRHLAGFHDLEQALDAIVFLRFLPLIFGGATVLVVFRIAGRLGGLPSGALAAVLLMTSVPFYNFGCQLRGYGLSMFLTASLLHEVLRPVHRPWLIALVSAALLYTLPSNAYLLVPIAVYTGLTPLDSRHSRTTVPVAILCGLGLGLVAYIPIIPQIRAYGAGRPSGLDLATLTDTAPRVAYHLLSGRWLLLVLPLAYFAVRLYHRSRAMPERLMFFAAIVFMVPFLISAIRGDGAPDRIFVPLIPVVCLAWGIVSGRAIGGLRGMLRPGAFWLTILLCGFALLRGNWLGEQKALADRMRGERCADLYFQYYLHGYHPRNQARRIAATLDPRIPAVNACRMDTELPKFLQMAGVDIHPSDSVAVYAGRRTPIYAVVDGMSLRSAGLERELPILTSPAFFFTPAVVFVEWSAAAVSLPATK